MPRQYSMDNRSQVSATTRLRVLDATAVVLADVGANNLTMQAVAKAADVALRTVYNHFPSKEALIVEAYNRIAGASQDAVRALSPDGTARERVARFVDAWYDTLDEQSPGAAAVLTVTGIPEYDAQQRAVRAWRRKELTAIVRQAEREGTLQIPVKEGVALVFLWTSFATWHSLVVESKLGPVEAKAVALVAVDRLLFESD